MKTVIAICLFGLVGCGGNGFTSAEGTSLPTPMDSDAGGISMGTGGVANLPSNNGGKAMVANETGGMPSATVATGGAPTVPSGNGGNANPTGNGGSPVLGTGGAMVNGAGGMAPVGTGGVPSGNGGSATGGTVSTTGPHCPAVADEFPNVHCLPGTYTVDCVGSLATFQVDRAWTLYLDKIMVPAGFNQTSFDSVTGFHYISYCQGPLTFTLPAI